MNALFSDPLLVLVICIGAFAAGGFACDAYMRGAERDDAEEDDNG